MTKGAGVAAGAGASLTLSTSSTEAVSSTTSSSHARDPRRAGRDPRGPRGRLGVGTGVAPGGFGPPRRPVSMPSPARTGPTGNDGPRRPARSARRMRTMSSPGQGSRAPAGADVGATLREMWATRPARLKEDRKIAGVAAAIARRYADRPDAGAGRVRGLAVLRGGPAGLPRRHPRPPAGRRDGPAPRDAGVGDRHRDAPRHRRGRLGVLRRPRHGDRHRRRGRPALRAAPQPRSPAGPAAPRRGRRRDAHGRARGRPEAAVVGSARRGTVRLGPPGARAAARAAEAAARRSCP